MISSVIPHENGLHPNKRAALRRKCCNTSVVFQLIRSLEKGYVISAANKDDINKLLKSLGTVRSLLSVQVGTDEEEILKNSIW